MTEFTSQERYGTSLRSRAWALLLKLYLSALDLIYHSSSVLFFLGMSALIISLSASSTPHATPRLNSRSSTAALALLKERPRCWVGVIDQINPPWVSVQGERGEELTLRLDQAYPEAREGDWVIYWVGAAHLERLRSAGALRERARLKRDVQELWERAHDGEPLKL